MASSFAVGGLIDIGFSKTADLLLAVSGSGRGVIDLLIEAVVARDDETDGYWLSECLLNCDGIGSHANETVQLAGVAGGCCRAG